MVSFLSSSPSSSPRAIASDGDSIQYTIHMTSMVCKHTKISLGQEPFKGSVVRDILNSNSGLTCYSLTPKIYNKQKPGFW